MKNHAFYKPNAVQIELVQGCNRKCSFCGSMGFESMLHFIDKKVLKKECELIAESGYKPRILIAGHGENTLHPHFYSCIKLIRKILPWACIQILTNGYSIAKNIDHIQAMFDAGINDISLDEYSDNRFNYTELQDFANTHGFKFEILGDKGVSFYTPKRHNIKRLMIVPPIDGDMQSMTRTLNNHCGAAFPPSTSCKDKVCAHVFRELIFRWDGWVNICCNDFRGEFRIANCMDVEHFDDLWRHDTFEAARRVLFHKKRIFFPCNICTAKSLRPGLIPDALGKETMEYPTEKDIELVKSVYKQGALAVLKPREWEYKTGKYTNGKPIKE